MASFNERILELRKQRELTQYELAKYIGVNKQTISQYERGVRRPDLDTLSALCDFFNVSTDYILGKVDITLRYVDADGLSRLDSTPAPTLTADENSLLLDYRKLNAKGRAKVREYAHDLTNNSDYTEDGLSSGVKTVAG